MKKQTLLALFVWAIDVDALSLSFERCWEMFQRDAWSCYKAFTNPNDDCYCEHLLGLNPIDVLTDYTLANAKSLVLSGIRNYGNYDKLILNYQR